MNWTPSPGSVSIATVVRCDGCGFEYETTPVKAIASAESHLCPAGTVTAFPTCPVCKSNGERCRNSNTLKPQAEWHAIRTRIWHDAIVAILERLRKSIDSAWDDVQEEDLTAIPGTAGRYVERFRSDMSDASYSAAMAVDEARRATEMTKP